MVLRHSLALAALALFAFIGEIPAQEARENVIDGVVKAIDSTKYEVTILRDNGKETTVKFYNTTNIRLDGKEAKFDSIKVKQEVRCVYLLEKNVATHFGMYVEIDRPPYRGKR